MIDRPDADPQPGDLPETQVRKPWHAPQLMVTDFAETDVNSHAGTDGGTMHSPS